MRNPTKNGLLLPAVAFLFSVIIQTASAEVIPAFAATPGIEATCVIEGDTFTFTWNDPTDVDGVFLERYSYNTTDYDIVYRKTYDRDNPETLDELVVEIGKPERSYIYSLCLSYPDPELSADTVYALFDFTAAAYSIPGGTSTGMITLTNITDAAHYYFNLDDRYYGLVYAGGQDINEISIEYPAGDYNLRIFGDERNPYDRYTQYTTEGSLAAGEELVITLDSNLFTE
ncbi:MAG: hypothetical protein GY771_06270 [bacterium]|nr:hypothetical protein [bacterium]